MEPQLKRWPPERGSTHWQPRCWWFAVWLCFQIHIDIPRMSPLISLFNQHIVQEVAKRIRIQAHRKTSLTLHLPWRTASFVQHTAKNNFQLYIFAHFLSSWSHIKTYLSAVSSSYLSSSKKPKCSVKEAVTVQHFSYHLVPGVAAIAYFAKGSHTTLLWCHLGSQITISKKFRHNPKKSEVTLEVCMADRFIVTW